MGYGVKVLLDSVNVKGVRLVSWELTYPRFVHSELMTHRVFSRSAASSRAIPIEKMIGRIETDPAMPVKWGKNQAGMQADEVFEGKDVTDAIQLWLGARNDAVKHARKMQLFGLHKQIVNRVTEPYMWITTLMTTTFHANWFEQRDHSAAEPSLAHMATLMHYAYWLSKPTFIQPGDWHMPLLPDRAALESEGYDVSNESGLYAFHETPYAGGSLQHISGGRCARVSYLNHNGIRDPQDDVQLYRRMAGSAPAHRAPLEHVAQSRDSTDRFGNFEGWKQLRHFIPNEAGPPEPRFNPETGECLNYDPVTRQLRA